MAAAVESTSYPSLSPPAGVTEIPRLLEYRGESDVDVEFIPKTIAGFCFGAMVFGFCLNIAEALYAHGTSSPYAIVESMMVRFAFMVGIMGVACSLLLVGLKVRADNSKVDLYHKHWLNSITTGAIYALMIWGPWILVVHTQGWAINRFLAAAVWMALMAFPAVAAKWMIGPHKHYGVN
jgi:hypothetical protein